MAGLIGTFSWVSGQAAEAAATSRDIRSDLRIIILRLEQHETQIARASAINADQALVLSLLQQRVVDDRERYAQQFDRMVTSLSQLRSEIARNQLPAIRPNLELYTLGDPANEEI
jgi:hypothetical protein